MSLVQIILLSITVFLGITFLLVGMLLYAKVKTYSRRNGKDKNQR